MYEVELVVEGAGCSSCADRIRGALEPIAAVAAIEVDEDTDVASVRLRFSSAASEEAVERVLRETSVGSGHGYRVRPGSWRASSVGG